MNFVGICNAILSERAKRRFQLACNCDIVRQNGGVCDFCGLLWLNRHQWDFIINKFINQSSPIINGELLSGEPVEICGLKVVLNKFAREDETHILKFPRLK